MGLDFFGVFLQGQIRTFDSTSGPGTTYDLWTDQPEAGNAAFPDELRALSYVTQVTTEMRLGMNAKITMVLTPPFEEGLAFLDSRLIQWGIGQLIVTFGYKTGTGAGNVAGPFVGLMQKPDVQIGTDVTITLHALGVGYALNLIGSGDPRTFPVGTSFAEAIELVLAEVSEGHGVSLAGIYDDFKATKDVDPFFSKPARVAKRDASFSGSTGAAKRDTELRLVRTDYSTQIDTNEISKEGASRSRQIEIDSEIARLREEQASKEGKIVAKYAADQAPGPIIVGPRNSWWFIHETLRNHGKELLIKGDKVKVVASENWLLNKEGQTGGFRKHFQVRGITDPNRNLFPVLAFSSPTSAVYMAPGVGKIAMQDIADDESRESAAKKTYDSGNSPSASTGEGEPETDKVTPVATKPLDSTKNMPGSPHDPEHRERAKAEWKRLRMDSGIRAEVTTLGIPTLLPGEVVQISGFLPRGSMGEPGAPPSLSDLGVVEGGINAKPTRGLFDGPYGVIKVVHTVGNGGYMTKFEGVSNYYPRQFPNARNTKSAQTDLQGPREEDYTSRVTVRPVPEFDVVES